MLLHAKDIKEAASQVGFDNCGIAPVRTLPQFSLQLQQWLSKGYNGEMHYMERHSDKRCSPALLLTNARSVISVIASYPNGLPIDAQRLGVARYAFGKDYHQRIKDMLWEMIFILNQQYSDFEGRAFVDTAPISDKLWAVEAGLGWIGRNTLLITPTHGSWVNIGEIVTTAEVDHYDKPIENLCGDCTLCVDACPNHALQPLSNGADSVYSLNAIHCTAYNTIENRSDNLPDDLQTAGYVFGCDRCQEVCPYNRHHKQDIPQSCIDRMEQIAQSNEENFAALTQDMPLSRITYRQWVRNKAKAKKAKVR